MFWLLLASRYKTYVCSYCLKNKDTQVNGSWIPRSVTSNLDDIMSLNTQPHCTSCKCVCIQTLFSVLRLWAHTARSSLSRSSEHARRVSVIAVMIAGLHNAAAALPSRTQRFKTTHWRKRDATPGLSRFLISRDLSSCNLWFCIYILISDYCFLIQENL